MGFSRFYTVSLLLCPDPTKTRHRTKQGSDFVTRMNTQKNRKMKAKLSEKQKTFSVVEWAEKIIIASHREKSFSFRFTLFEFIDSATSLTFAAAVAVEFSFSFTSSRPLFRTQQKNVVDFSKQNHFCVVRMEWREKTRRNGREQKKTSVCHFHPLFLPFQGLSSPFEWAWRVEKQSQFAAKKKRRVVENYMNQKCRLHAPTMATEEQKKMRNQIWFTSSDQRRGEEGVTKRR